MIQVIYPSIRTHQPVNEVLDGAVAVRARTSVALARARRTKATFKADLEEHHGGKQPARKKGKVSSADNRWSKRFAWPDEVSTGHSTVLCGGLIASVQLIISVNTLTVPPPLLCLMPET